MKKFCFVLCFLFPIFSYAEVLSLKVLGMHCEGCKQSIEKAVCGAKNYTLCNVEIVDRKLQWGKVVLQAEGEIDTQQVVKTIEDLGYRVEQEKPKMLRN